MARLDVTQTASDCGQVDKQTCNEFILYSFNLFLDGECPHKDKDKNCFCPRKEIWLGQSATMFL